MTDTTEPLSMSDRAKADAHKSLLERAKRAEARAEQLETDREQLHGQLLAAGLRESDVLARANLGDLRTAELESVIAALHEAGTETDDPAAGVRELAAQRDAAIRQRDEEWERAKVARAALAKSAAATPPAPPEPDDIVYPKLDATGRGEFLGWRFEGKYAHPIWSKDPPAPPEEPAPKPPRYRDGCPTGGVCLNGCLSVESCVYARQPVPAPEPPPCSYCGWPPGDVIHETGRDCVDDAHVYTPGPVPAPELAPEPRHQCCREHPLGPPDLLNLVLRLRESMRRWALDEGGLPEEALAAFNDASVLLGLPESIDGEPVPAPEPAPEPRDMRREIAEWMLGEASEIPWRGDADFAEMVVWLAERIRCWPNVLEPRPSRPDWRNCGAAECVPFVYCPHNEPTPYERACAAAPLYSGEPGQRHDRLGRAEPAGLLPPWGTAVDPHPLREPAEPVATPRDESVPTYSPGDPADQAGLYVWRDDGYGYDEHCSWAVALSGDDRFKTEAEARAAMQEYASGIYENMRAAAGSQPDRAAIEAEYEQRIRLLTEHRALCVAALRKVQEVSSPNTWDEVFDIATDALSRLDQSADGGGL